MESAQEKRSERHRRPGITAAWNNSLKNKWYSCTPYPKPLPLKVWTLAMLFLPYPSIRIWHYRVPYGEPKVRLTIQPKALRLKILEVLAVQFKKLVLAKTSFTAVIQSACTSKCKGLVPELLACRQSVRVHCPYLWQAVISTTEQCK